MRTRTSGSRSPLRPSFDDDLSRWRPPLPFTVWGAVASNKLLGSEKGRDARCKGPATCSPTSSCLSRGCFEGLATEDPSSTWTATRPNPRPAQAPLAVSGLATMRPHRWCPLEVAGDTQVLGLASASGLGKCVEAEAEGFKNSPTKRHFARMAPHGHGESQSQPSGKSEARGAKAECVLWWPTDKAWPGSKLPPGRLAAFLPGEAPRGPRTMLPLKNPEVLTAS